MFSSRSGRLSLAPAILLLLVAGSVAWLVLKQPPPEPVTMIQIRRMIRAKEFSDARLHLAERVAAAPGDKELTLLLIDVCQSLGDSEGAMDAAAEFPKEEADDYSEIMLRAALIAMQGSWPDRCEAYLKNAIASEPNDVMPYRLLIRLYHMLRNRPALRQHIANMDRLGLAVPRDALMFGPGGEIGWDDTSYVSWLESARRNTPDDLFVVAALARALPRLDRGEERSELLAEHKSSARECWTLALEFAEDHLREQRPAAALEVLSNTTDDAELSAEVWMLRAKALKRLKAIDEAVLSLQNARVLAPNDPASLEPLMQLYELQGKTEAAQALRRMRKPLDRYRQLVKYFFESNGQSAEFGEISRLLGSFGQWRAAQICQGESMMPGYLAALKEDPAIRTLNVPSLESLVTVDVASFSPEEMVDTTATTPVRLQGLRLVDIAQQKGLTFRFQNVKQESDVLLKSLGGGVGVLDFDNDDWPDLYFGQGDVDAANPQSALLSDVLFRNTRGAGYQAVGSEHTGGSPGFSHGVTAADFDNDGFTDIFVSRFGKNCLLHNNGDGTFTDISSQLPPAPLWSTSAAFVDVELDGDPDLYISSYVDADLSGQLACNTERGLPCTLRDFQSQADVLLLNDGTGTFVDSSASVRDTTAGSGLGVMTFDYDHDGRPDIFVGNDTSPNIMLSNQSTNDELVFVDKAVPCGVAVGSSGRPQACMGIACGDVDGNGWWDIVVTNFQNQPNSLYLNNGGLFEEAGDRFGLANSSRKMLSWGTQFCDVNGDAWPDLVVANGHLYDRPMPLQLFVNQRGKSFVQVAGQKEILPTEERHGRSLALVDWNRDGRSDFVVSNIGQNASLIENQSSWTGGRLLRLVGVQSSRNAEGALVTIESSAGARQQLRCSAGGGFFSTNDVALVLPTDFRVTSVSWPSGQTSTNVTLFPGERVSVIVEESVDAPTTSTD